MNCARGIFTGAGVLNFRPATGSSVFMQYADLSNAPIALSCSTGATVGAENIVARNCSNTAVSVQGGVSIDLTAADLSGATQYGLRCTTASITNASNIILNNCGYGAYAENGAVLDLQNAEINESTIAGVVATKNATVNANNASIYRNKVGLIALHGAQITANNANIRESIDQSLSAQFGGTIIANNANYRKAADSDTNMDAIVSNYGTIIALSSTGGAYQKTDVRTANGIIIKGQRKNIKFQATMPAGVTSHTVNHNLGVVPTYINSSPNGNLDGRDKWDTNRTANTFDIRVSTALESAMLFYCEAEI